MKILKATWEAIAKNLMAASLLANFISFLFFFFLFRIGDDLVQIKDLPLSFAKKIGSQKFENVVDSISYASQLGRLDTVSLLLAIFAIILGFGAVVGFLHIKDTSQMIASKETKEWLSSDGGKKELNQMLIKVFNDFYSSQDSRSNHDRKLSSSEEYPLKEAIKDKE
jgi:hypothetical protein